MSKAAFCKGEILKPLPNYDILAPASAQGSESSGKGFSRAIEALSKTRCEKERADPKAAQGILI